MTPDQTRPVAHAALRYSLDLAQALSEAGSFPGAFSNSDREVLAKRLRDVNSACAPLLRLSPISAKR